MGSLKRFAIEGHGVGIDTDIGSGGEDTVDVNAAVFDQGLDFPPAGVTDGGEELIESAHVALKRACVPRETMIAIDRAQDP